MTDYTELVKALRICGKGDCVDCDKQRQDKCLKRHWNNENLIDGMLCEAAAAIEELQQKWFKSETDATNLTGKLAQAEADIDRLNWEIDKRIATEIELSNQVDALQAEVDEQKQITAHYEQTAKDYWKEACEYHAIVSAKDITAKESEELIRKFKKLPCGPIEPNEPKRGEWVEENRRPRSSQFVCSECHRTAYDPQPTRDKAWRKRCRYAYCPNCGAKMEVQE